MGQILENREVAIQLSGVKKQYRLGQIGGGTLQKDIQSWWARRRGNVDPNAKIGQEQRLVGETFMALNGIDLTIYKGEAVGIIGGNGAGKSTMLKLLSRVTAPSEGIIDIYGRIASMLEVGTGFHGEMTGRENVYMNGAILGMTKAEIDAKMEDIIEFSEVREFIDTPVKRYSSGMYVKLAFSVAAHLDSEIMIMDEVLAVGDMAFQKKCLDKMKEAANKEGRTVLYVSHNMNTIRQLCDRCIVLDKGRVIFEGAVEEAIGLYLGTQTDKAFPTYYDYSKKERSCHFGQQLFVTAFEILNKECAEFEVGEDIEFMIQFNSKISINEMRCIVRIKDQYNVEKIAGCLSEPFKVCSGEKKQVRFKMSTEGITEDIYTLSFEIIERDQTGNYFSYDNPAALIPIQIQNKDENDIVWAKQYWGNVRLPEMKIV